ncbi:YbhB/YbcL family Raf kinase inhibitor-like protein [Candidatus Methylacidiphilum infernorum]|uniref:YbhB/YbcL family Raf kinase inhibitor-like protein n=1 Tax=Candidatus Methylacidiphilum infernorum TaxID=511746 RepID=A0ABX7PV01_9BACT|nr:YbhB/YbcL family Raf kinase inhibitor-like protein [Candidatus Methylacidiphilum infernorum]QSR86777.1 YbhB/YbcL family Raf kinase inhibitor-like protein [Candidatus Methylacidiphilum infernorum]
MKLSSPDFENGKPLPQFCAYHGENRSPELKIEDVPQNTKSLALIMDDPDAPRGTWVHWVLWNIPAETRIIKKGEIPPGAVAGRNDFGNTQFDGPAPPSGIHRYYFRVYALDSSLALPKGSTKAELLKKMHGHVLASAELMGTFAASR